MSARTVKAFLLVAATLMAAAANAATLDVSPTSVPRGASVTATWSGIATPTSTDWIALAVPGAANTSYISFRYTTGAASGNVPFTIPSTLAPGTYQLRLFANNGYTLLATSSNFTVTLPNISLAASPASVLPGGIETAEWSGIPAPASSDWLGLFTPGAPNGSYLSWRYTTGTASGSVPFIIPTTVAPGTYQLRLFAGSSTLLATSGNFTVGLAVSGTVTANGSLLANVGLTATNGGVCGSSNASGQYTCIVPTGWSGSVTPSLAGYGFAPSSRTYTNVTVAQTAQNYSATAIFQLTGTVSFNSSALVNVAFAASNGGSCTSSNASGQYSCSVPQGWSGTVTPALSGYMFTARSYSNVAANQSAQDYAAAIQTYQLGGTVSLNGLPLADVAFTATNGGVCTPSTGWGQYTCTVAQGWSGTVTPSASGYSFAPSSRSHGNVANDQTGHDFAATLVSASAPMFFVHVDQLNTPRLLADSNGTAVWRRDNPEPFSDSPPDENPSGLGFFEFPLGFPGQYFDKETGNWYNGFRDYASQLGRYVQSDPIGLKGGINTYTYASLDPLRKTDPAGLAEIAEPPVKTPPTQPPTRSPNRGPGEGPDCVNIPPWTILSSSGGIWGFMRKVVVQCQYYCAPPFCPKNPGDYIFQRTFEDQLQIAPWLSPCPPSWPRSGFGF